MLPIYAPSWVMPGSVAENAVFLRNKVRGVMLCAFEHAPRLPVELPETRGDLHWHVHLPTDLPWEAGGEAAGRAACRIMRQTKHLHDKATLAVLHPPRAPAAAPLKDFLRVWRAEGLPGETLILENLPETELDALITLTEIMRIGICLDVAHLALSGNMKHAAANRNRLEAVRMVHWSAPENGRDAHAPLTAYPVRDQIVCRELARQFPHAADVIEIFDWPGVRASWELLRAWRETTP